MFMITNIKSQLDEEADSHRKTKDRLTHADSVLIKTQATLCEQQSTCVSLQDELLAWKSATPPTNTDAWHSPRQRTNQPHLSIQQPLEKEKEISKPTHTNPVNNYNTQQPAPPQPPQPAPIYSILLHLDLLDALPKPERRRPWTITP